MRKLILCVVLLLALPALACSFSVGTGGETPEPTTAPPPPNPGLATPVPPTPTTPPPAGPNVYNVLFASEMTADERPVALATEFLPGTAFIYAFANFEGMSDKLECESVWYLDEEEVARSSFSWGMGESGGPLMIAYIEKEGGLPAGDYLWELHVDGQLAAMGGFPVSGQPPSSVLWEDDFSDPGSGWSTGPYNSGEVSYEGGELRIRNYTASGFATFSNPGLWFSDLIIEVESRLVDGSEDNWHHLVCRHAEPTTYYVASYSADGYYTSSSYVGNEQTQLVSPTPSDAIRQGVGVTNVATLECVGNQLRFWVNGELLVDVTDSAISEGDIGLGAGSMGGEYSQIAFDNLVVSSVVDEGTRSPILLQDDFSDPGSGWEVGDYPAGSVGYRDGAYYVTSTAEDKTMWGLASQSFSDVVIEVDATQVFAPANNDNGYGVMCRVQANGMDGYTLRISGDGYSSIARVVDGSPEALGELSESEAIRQGNAMNRLRVVCDGSTLALFVNGELAAEASDTSFTEGDIALIVATYEDEATEVHFDNLVVTRPAP